MELLGGQNHSPQPKRSCRPGCHKNFSLHINFPGRTPWLGELIRAWAKQGGGLRAADADGVEGLQLLHFPPTVSKMLLPVYINTKAFVRCCASQPAAHNAPSGWEENKQLPKIAALSLTASPSAQGRGRSQTGLEKGQGGEEDAFGKQK